MEQLPTGTNDTLIVTPRTTRPITYDGGDGLSDRVRFDYRAVALAMEYRFDTGRATARRLDTGGVQSHVNFSGTENVEVDAGPGADTFPFPGTPPPYRVDASGGDGDDTFSIGGGSLGNDVAFVTMDGEGGRDTFEFTRVRFNEPINPAKFGEPIIPAGR